MARAVYQSLTSKGYDVFFDYEGINSGDFEQIVLGNLRARAHFLVILTPSALERCSEPGDWLRREIETAIDEKRNIIPLFFEGFNFGSATISQYLTGKMTKLKNYNGLNVPSDYFNEAIDKLINRFLNTPLDAVIHPLSNSAKKGADVQKAAIKRTVGVTENELSAEEWFEKGYKEGEAKHHEEAIQCYTEAIRLNPDYALAYNNRGFARRNKEDFAGAIQDLTEAIRLKPDFAIAYNNRGLVHIDKGDFSAAIKDCTEAIRLQSDFALAYNNRGVARLNLARFNKGDFASAIQDCTKAIRLKPDYAEPYATRAAAYYDKGDFYTSLLDYQTYIKLEGTNKINVENFIPTIKAKLNQQ
jgi:tetratricopeptide (TPR) repeat protein